MYISMVALNATDSYEQHQAIWSLFPNTPERRRDHLFRVEDQTGGSKATVILQSSTEPRSSSSATVLNTKPYNPKVEAGACYRFKILANPTRKISATKKIVEIKDDNAQIEWLQRKLPGANVTITAMDSKLVFSRKSFKSRYVCFEGVLQVTDPEKMLVALTMGVGRKKHAGAGLLSLAKSN
jgi:CRISPR system Cascade subunit CasE